MRLNINEQASKELLAIMTAMNFSSTTHTLNKIISQCYKVIANTHNNCEVIHNDNSSTDHNQ